MRIVSHLLLVLGLTLLWHPCDAQRLSDERVVFQTTKGDIELAFFPDVAPRHSRAHPRSVQARIIPNEPFL